MKPREIRLHRQSAVLDIDFGGGASFSLPAEFLRVHSPSAEVQGHGPGQRTIQEGKRDVTIVDVKPQGNYAIKLVFSDGHDSGVYTWRYLHDLGTRQSSLWQTYLEELEAAGKTRESKFIAVSR